MDVILRQTDTVSIAMNLNGLRNIPEKNDEEEEKK